MLGMATTVLVLAVASAALGTMVRIYNYPVTMQAIYWTSCLVTTCISAAWTFKRL
jgi:hypothetical protein